MCVCVFNFLCNQHINKKYAILSRIQGIGGKHKILHTIHTFGMHGRNKSVNT